MAYSVGVQVSRSLIVLTAVNKTCFDFQETMTFRLPLDRRCPEFAAEHRGAFRSWRFFIPSKHSLKFCTHGIRDTAVLSVGSSAGWEFKKTIYLLYLKKGKIRKDIPEGRFSVCRARCRFWLLAWLSCDLQTSLDTQTSERLQVLQSTAKHSHCEPCYLLEAKLA